MKKRLNYYRIILRGLAITILAASLAVWISGGAHVGWTKTSVAVERLDEITGIAFRDYEDRFVPGVEFPAAGAAAAAGLLLLSLFVGPRRPARTGTA